MRWKKGSRVNCQKYLITLHSIIHSHQKKPKITTLNPKQRIPSTTSSVISNAFMGCNLRTNIHYYSLYNMVQNWKR